MGSFQEGPLSDEILITTVVAPSAGVAASTDLASAEVDMSGYDGVMLIASMGVITAGAVTSMKAQQDTVTGMGSAADLLGTSITIAADDDDQLFVLDIFNPQERFLRAYFDRATQNAVISSCIAIRYKAKSRPQVNTVTDLVTLERHVAPAEGTA